MGHRMKDRTDLMIFPRILVLGIRERMDLAGKGLETAPSSSYLTPDGAEVGLRLRSLEGKTQVATR